METLRLTMAQALIRFLNQQYVQYDGKEDYFVEGIFTTYGHGCVLGVGQALQENPGHLRVFQAKNEQGGAFAATAFARQMRRKKIMASVSSVGPGAANMVTAAGEATTNNIPLLLLPGDTFASRQPDPVLQQVEHTNNPGMTTNDAFKAVTKYWDRVQRPEQLMSAMLNAMRVLTDEGDTGAVCVALPQDVQGEVYDYPLSFFKKRVHVIHRHVPVEADLEQAAEQIAAAKHPMIICGGGTRYAEADQALRQLSEYFQIPVTETQAGKGVLSSDVELNLGGIGVTGNAAANFAAKRADVVLAVGTRFTDFTTGSKSLFENPDVSFININVSPFHALKLDGFPIQADAKLSLEGLSRLLKAKKYQAVVDEALIEARDKWRHELERLASITYIPREAFTPEVLDANQGSAEEFYKQMNQALTQTRAFDIIQKTIGEDAIVVGASGSLPADLERLWRPTKPDTYHVEYGYSCMGYEVAGALGVKLAQPDREVYAFVGDGAFLMLHSELITSLQEHQKINVLLFDNSGFGCINNLQAANGLDNAETEFRFYNEETGKHDGSLFSIDYARVASGYGVHTYTAKTAEELRHALKDAQSQKESTLIDIKVMPKTMTHDYDAWWHVGVPERSHKKEIEKAYACKQKKLASARKY